VSPRAAKKSAAAEPVVESPASDAAAGVPARQTVAGSDRILLFALDGQHYGLPIAVVQEIQQMVALSQIPDDEGAVVGVINLRGAVVPVMDLRRMLGLPPRVYGLQTPMVFVRTPQGVVSLVVDEVEDVVEVPPDCMQPTSEVFALADRLLGVCRLDVGPVFVLDIERLIPAGRRSRS
jgi:purine-binding chemotaxis protein CheW